MLETAGLEKGYDLFCDELSAALLGKDSANGCPSLLKAAAMALAGKLKFLFVLNECQSKKP